MTTVLITAFEPYDRWPENASWLALLELTRDLPPEPKVVTRRYPVDFASARTRLFEDLAANYDFALHLGQSPGSSRVMPSHGDRKSKLRKSWVNRTGS